MPIHSEIRLAIWFTAFLVVVTLLLTLLWWSENRDSRPVRWLLASDAAFLLMCGGVFSQPLLGFAGATMIAAAGISFGLALGYVCLVQSVGGNARFGAVIGAATVIVAVQTTLAATHPGDLGLLFVVMSALLAPALMLMAWSVFREVTSAYTWPLAVVLSAPFGLTAMIYLARLVAMIAWPDEERTIMFTGFIALALGVDATAFLFALAHLRNNQDAAKLERARCAAEAASEAKSGFLRSMSHELRTPLNAIIGFSELMRHHSYPISMNLVRENAEHIHAAGRYLLEMIEDLLDLTSISAGKTALNETRFRTDEMIGEVAHLVRGRAEQRGLTLHVGQAMQPELIFGDRRRLIQAVVNLASNAVKFTPERGRVLIDVRLGTDGAIEIIVSDTGIGMTPAEIEVALTPFGQNRRHRMGSADGVGIGLPLARELVLAHGGDLLIESAPGQGTLARTRLPASRIVDIDSIPEIKLRAVS